MPQAPPGVQSSYCPTPTPRDGLKHPGPGPTPTPCDGPKRPGPGSTTHPHGLPTGFPPRSCSFLLSFASYWDCVHIFILLLGLIQSLLKAPFRMMNCHLPRSCPWELGPDFSGQGPQSPHCRHLLHIYCKGANSSLTLLL